MNTYTYDAENRISIRAGVTYFYDGDGRRVKKSASSVVKLYWYDVTGNVLAETGGSGNLQNEYVFFNGSRIASAVSAGFDIASTVGAVKQCK